jgi:hypothetical protein
MYQLTEDLTSMEIFEQQRENLQFLYYYEILMCKLLMIGYETMTKDGNFPVSYVYELRLKWKWLS